MMQEEREGIVAIYSSGVKMTLKARKVPMETTVDKSKYEKKIGTALELGLKTYHHQQSQGSV